MSRLSNLSNRIRHLLQHPDRLRAAGRRSAARTRSCTDLPMPDLLALVTAATAEQDLDLLRRIDARAGAGASGEDDDPHHFVVWLWGLQLGSWDLPARIPRAVL